MLTIAGKKGITGLFVWSRAGSNYTAAKNLSGTSSDTYRIFNSEYNYSTAGNTPITSTSGYGIVPGTSVDEPTEDEYMIPTSDRELAGLTYVSSECQMTDAKYVRYTYINKTTDEITVNCTYCTAVGFLIDHTKLDEPIKVAPEQSVVFTYKLGLP